MKLTTHTLVAHFALCALGGVAHAQAPAGDAAPPVADETPTSDDTKTPVETPTETPAEAQPLAEVPAEPSSDDGEDEVILLDTDDDEEGEEVDLEAEGDGDGMTIIGDRDELAKMGGSAHTVDKEFLETFEFDDIHRALTVVPGTSVRDEDGFGLRPNIGLRGVSPERSAKITLLEDGVLFGPAPYSAPAAYYFPMMTRMVQIEVFKGPAAVQHGPQTIAGAINLVTRAIPGVKRDPETGVQSAQHRGQIDVSGGQYLTGKAHGWYGYGDKHWGVLVEGVHLRSDGFKELDGGGDTGFEKNEAMLKLRLNSSPGEIFHRFDLKLGYADELSNETYLGLTDADFDANPLRRYAASAEGLMDWRRTQIQASYRLLIGEDFDLRITGYRHDFTRAWTKLNRMESGSSLRDLINNPNGGQNAVLYEVLTGAQDSTGIGDALFVGTNDRDFISQGVQLNGDWSIGGSQWFSQKLSFGVRLHTDEINRNHTEDRFLMQSGRLVADASAQTITTTTNTGSTNALAVHALDKITVGESIFLTPGARLEVISNTFEDDLSGDTVTDDYSVFLPGMGLFWQATDHFGLLAGVHKGFSAKSPGSDPNVGAEEAINYEAGTRFSFEGGRGELIGFFSDYSNIIANCTISAGCDNNQEQFSGGAVDIYGLEAVLAKAFKLGGGYTFDTSLTYTLTMSEFKNSFASRDPLFGDVEEGDRLPYLPIHQGQLSLGLMHDVWGVNTLAHFTSEALDESGTSESEDVLKIEGRVIVDVAAYYRPYAAGRIYLRANNVTDQTYVASRRPYGARPGRPLMVVGGFKHSF
ncbi:MAG: TonB-dependent receptor family protein [Bradymonadia bacterium]